MDEEEKTELDEELDELETEDSDNSEETADDSDEFEYDDDGNIIIPETIDDDQEDNEEETDDEGESSDDEENEGSEESEADAEPTPAESEKDREYAELKAKYAALEAQGKETLAKLGVKSDSVIEGFEKVAAESDDISLEEYRKKKADNTETSQNNVVGVTNELIAGYNKFEQTLNSFDEKEDERQKTAMAAYIQTRAILKILVTVYANSKNVPQGVKDLVNLEYADVLKLVGNEETLKQLVDSTAVQSTEESAAATAEEKTETEV